MSPGWRFAEQGGVAIYVNVCAACHQPDAKGAEGAGAYPALAGNPELASGDYVLRVVLNGLRGMPPVGGILQPFAGSWRPPSVSLVEGRQVDVCQERR